jgi:hypothetical protein
VIWIPSTVFFKFLARRLVELENTQLHLARNRPTNYGTMTSVIMYLIRHIMVTPTIRNTFLNEALRDLRYASVMERFGIFFLHDLKLRNGVLYLRELPQEDPIEVVHLYGASLKSRMATVIDRPHRLIETTQQDYPWGADPSWSRIQQLLETEPENFLGKWKLDDDWMDPEHFLSEQLFILFTTQLWLSITEQFVSAGVLPNPITLEDAMETWTISSIHSILGPTLCRFLPSSNGLQGKLPPNQHHQLSFRQRRTLYFPDPATEINNNSIWHPYTEKSGYIFTYHQYLREWANEDVIRLHNNLDNIFHQLQCLPLTLVHNKNKSIWSATSGKVNFITNSKFYPIREVGKGVTQHHSKVAKRPQVSRVVLQKRLREACGEVAERGIERRSRAKLKSTKTLRKRKPPVRTRSRVQQPLGQEQDPVVFQRITRSKAKAAREIEEQEQEETSEPSRSDRNSNTSDPAESSSDW